MEVINRNHKAITFNTRVRLADYLRVELKEFYFSAGCNVHLGIVPYRFIHFMNDDERWLFYLNMDKDGFPTLIRKNKKSTIVINASLCKLFLKRTGTLPGTKFLVKKTEAMMQNSPVYEIMINETIE